MLRRLAFPVSLLLLTLSIITVSSAQTSWQKVIDREAGFTISFPGRPTYQTTTDSSTGLQTEIYKFFYTGRLLRITFAPLPQPVRSPADFSRVYSEFSQQVVPMGGMLLSQQKLPDGGRQYDTAAKDEHRTIYGRTRFYLRNGRYYAIAFEMYAQDRLDEREAERFLSSFSFLDALPKQRVGVRNKRPTSNVAKRSALPQWYTFRSPDSAFTVEFPGKPSYQLDPASQDSASFHRYYYFYGENVFQVSYREDQEFNTKPEQIIRKVLEDYTSPRTAWRVLSQIQLPDGGYQIESQDTSKGSPFYSRVRLYVRGTRVYYVTALTQNLSGPNENDVTRFFDSFRFL